MIDISKLSGFEWDKGNITKSYKKHGISIREAEEAFLDENVFLQEDIKHSEKEERFIAISQASTSKVLFPVFTVRAQKIRIISTRSANQKERRLYEKKLKPIPHFDSEAKENDFWQTHDSTEYIDYSTARRVSFPNLKLTTKPITIRLPESLIERAKTQAHKMDIPYQALIKKFIFEGLAR